MSLRVFHRTFVRPEVIDFVGPVRRPRSQSLLWFIPKVFDEVVQSSSSKLKSSKHASMAFALCTRAQAVLPKHNRPFPKLFLQAWKLSMLKRSNPSPDAHTVLKCVSRLTALKIPQVDVLLLVILHISIMQLSSKRQGAP